MSTDHYLSEEQLAHFKKTLIEKKASLIDLINSKSKETQTNHAAESDVLDIASNLEEKNRLISEIDRDTAMLKRVNLAIEHFNEDFGYCVDCGVEIGVKRLKFDPSATRCFECQNIFENQARLYNK